MLVLVSCHSCFLTFKYGSNELAPFSKQIRRSILNEDEYGFRKAKRPIYYDEGLEVTSLI